METNRRRFVGATLGLLGGIAFRIPEPPKILGAASDVEKDVTGYRGIVHTDRGDIVVPIARVEGGTERKAMTFFFADITQITMSMTVYACTVINSKNQVCGEGKKRFPNSCAILPGDTLRVTSTLRWWKVQ
jgi:hypothetical protein